ncbi:UPF0187-domain-containing protein [Neolentinus lepideus HHB14362 ss-1]|uniref:UPF0187-domain-containing protein n=1 Tax=Neolentinus lepideus HHB14362 ss-1 TaxID=1314782 RepID=A0A165RQA0_9AGAM|nr:UPF0187-domain-containing protein [Neolentinus lepideus HHB14362 ss-1]
MVASTTVKSSVTLVIPKPPRIRRKHLRKYSWLPDVFRVEGSIISRIFGPVLTVTIFATLIAYLWKSGYNVTLTNSVIPVVAVVVGLILVFRNGTSYDRFYEGRKDFASMTSHIRNLARLIWVNVSVPPLDDSPSASTRKTPQPALTASQLRRKKAEVLRLCLSFAYAVKHYVRDEDGVHWDDYAGLLPASIMRYDEVGLTQADNGSYASLENSLNISSPTSPNSIAISRAGTPRDATKRVRPKRSKQKVAANSKTPLLGQSHHALDFRETSAPLPLVIAHEITRALFKFKRDGYLETVGPAGTNALNTLVQSMVDQMTSMERIANTPIPVSYRIHLKQAVTLYLFALPFTLIKELGWSMIPIVTVVAFTFMGIEGIADEIENPFGHDKSDLPLDRYCSDLKEEIEYIIDRLPEGGEGMFGFDDGEGDD